MAIEADGALKPLEYRSSALVAVVIIFVVFVVAGVVSVCVTMFGVGWNVYLDWLGELPDRGSRPTSAVLLTLGMGFCLPLGLFVLLGFCFPPARTRIDAKGIEVRYLMRRRSFAWHEIADIYVHEGKDRYRNKFHYLNGRLHSGKRFFLPGLTGTDFGVEELRQIREELMQRRSGIA